jgi:hypothetical protein
MMTTARPVDLSATRTALLLVVTTLLARLLDRTPSAGLLRRIERACSDLRAALADRQVQVQENRYASTTVEGWKIV